MRNPILQLIFHQRYNVRKWGCIQVHLHDCWFNNWTSFGKKYPLYPALSRIPRILFSISV